MKKLSPNSDVDVVIPWPRLAVTLVVAVAAGVLAAAWPAFRVSRVPVLELVSGDR